MKRPIWRSIIENKSAFLFGFRCDESEFHENLDKFVQLLNGVLELDEETIPTFEYIKKLNDYNLAYVHLSEPFTDVSEIPVCGYQRIAKHFLRLQYITGTTTVNSNLIRLKGSTFLTARGCMHFNPVQ
jgi:hypothetical protein